MDARGEPATFIGHEWSQKTRTIQNISRSRSFVVTHFSSSSYTLAAMDSKSLTHMSAKLLLPLPMDHSICSGSSLLSNTTNEWPKLNSSDISDSGVKSSRIRIAILHRIFSSTYSSSDIFVQGSEARIIRPPANNNLSSTPLPFRDSSYIGPDDTYTFSAPSQFSVNRAQKRSTCAKNRPPRPIDVLKANGRSKAFRAGQSPSSTPKTEENEEEKDQEKNGKIEGQDRRCNFITGPSPSQSPAEEVSGKRKNLKSKSDHHECKFIIEPNTPSNPTEDCAKNLGWW